MIDGTNLILTIHRIILTNDLKDLIFQFTLWEFSFQLNSLKLSNRTYYSKHMQKPGYVIQLQTNYTEILAVDLKNEIVFIKSN